MLVVLRFPHLVLADVGDDHRLSFGEPPDVVDHVRRVEVAIVGQRLDVADGGVPLEIVDVREPRRAVARRDVRQPLVERQPQIPGNRDVDADVLVQLGAIDVDVDLLGVARVGLEVAGDAVVEPHAERDQQVGFLDRVVDPRLTVHAHHAEVERMRGGDAADAEQGDGDRNLRTLGELEDLPLGVGQHHAVAGEDQRPFGGVDQRDCLAQIAVARQRVIVGLGKVGFGRVPVHFAAALLRVLGDVHQHRARTAAARDRERFADRRRDVLGRGDQVVVLGDRQRDAGDVGLLERVGSDQLAADLAGDADDRRRIHHRGGDAGDHVGRARTGGGDRDADLPRRAGVAVGHVRGALLVPHQHVANRVLQHRVVGRQNRAARIAEHVGHAFADQRFPENLRACEFHPVTAPCDADETSFTYFANTPLV